MRRAHASVVRILGTACGLAVQGSGWVAAPGLVVTNAHVVAGEDDTTVEADGGRGMDAQAVAFDPHNDVAVLRVAGLERAGAAPAHRTRRVGAPVGDPRLSPRTAPTGPMPGRLGATRTVISQDAYGNGPVRGA